MSLSNVMQPILHPIAFFNSFRKTANWRTFKGDLQRFFKNVNDAGEAKRGNGEVYILGAGPGDPELLTLKAYRLLQEADVVLFDWLVTKEMLDLIPASAIRQFVGKRCGQHSCSQDTICNLMLEHASLGRKVVRLKGGDPSIFGRVSEECEALEKANIPYAIIPGVTAASGMAAYTGMPLTDRRYAQSVRFITATLKDKDHEPDWSNMVANGGSEKGQDTLVFYMGLKRIATIAQRLEQHGMNPNMPVAVIDQATCKEQRKVHGCLSDIATKVEMAKFQGPALFVVGGITQSPFDVSAELLANRMVIR
ncbi:MAG: uroporphyrinogen-III C-methyltransferase [Alteromonadaceae bacterium]|nr:uroporphyrinogen-III C-methyltransferase [Alteromonadaceae bacterium]